MVQITTWCGFKIVGDNLDKTVKPRYMRINKQARSLNYFNSFAVKDRIDLSSLSSLKPVIDDDVNVQDLLPSSEIHSEVLKNVAVLVSRILVDNISVFNLTLETVISSTSIMMK